MGGWLAQGGAGIGSYEYGWFIKNVIKAKVIDVLGNEKVYKGEELELISDTEGIMGFITEVTLKVQPLEELGVFAATFQNPTDLKNFMESVTESDIPVWSFLFINPKMAVFKNIVPLKEHLGHPDENRLVLPENYIVTIAFRQKDENEVVGKLSGLVKDNSGNKLDNEFAQHEWDRRFKIMQVKRLGPSLVPVEIVVPVSNFAEFTDKVSKLIKQPIFKEGILIKNSDRSEVVIHGFIPGDQRTFKYHFVFSLFLSIMKIIEKLGGRLYSTGLYFTANGKQKTVVTWHDSCHMGRVSRVYDQPRELIKAIPGVEFREMASNKENAKCYGSVLTLLKEPDVAAVIGKDRIDEAVDIKAEKILALCPCCEFQLRVSADKKGIPMGVVDLAHFTAEALGHKLPDPNPEVKKQWAVFEAMIALMTPEGFAKRMGTMWKELINAMPLGMGHMMRFFGKIPLMLSLMKPLFPVLFPIMLPIMMPKVMQTMLKRVEDVVPMPDYMKEQMPLMMPGIMDNLMPHMIKDIVPLITQPMINYLRGKVS